MEAEEQQLRRVLNEISLRERKAYVRSSLLTLAPLVIGAIFIGVSAYKVRQLNTQKAGLDQEVKLAAGQVNDLKTDISRLEEQKTQKSRELAGLKRLVAPLTSTDQRLAEKVAEVIPADISISIQRESQRVEAKRVVSELRTRGYLVYRISLENYKGPNETQVRYFRRGQPGEANNITAILRELGFVGAYSQWTDGYENSPTAGEYQIFFGLNVLEQNNRTAAGQRARPSK